MSSGAEGRTFRDVLKGAWAACFVAAAATSMLAGCEKAVEETVVEVPPPPPPPPVPAGVEEITEPVEIVMPDPADDESFVHDRRSQVSMLLYHDLSTTNSSNPMKINVSKFKAQMENLKENGIPVISMSDFMKWKRGEINIPEFCVLITFDDGWREVYTMAFPVLKELEFPFTLFLYTKYLDIGGRSLTFDQIEEMTQSGAEIGSHSVSHQNLTDRRGLSQSGYDEYLVRELGESRAELMGKFGESYVDVFSYPYGSYSEEIRTKGLETGYEMLLTVDGKKNAWDTPSGEIGRYIIHGNEDTNIGYALTFRGNSSLAGGGKNLLAPVKGTEEPLVTTKPAEGETVAERLPLVEVDLSKLEGVDPASISMTVSGLGVVPAVYDPVSRILRHQMGQRLRDEVSTISVRLRRSGEEGEDIIAWSFSLERTPYYLREEAVVESGP